MKFDTLIINAEICDCNSSRGIGWLAIKGNIIAATGSGDAPADIFTQAADIIDAEKAFLIPALIDSHVHFRTPGMEHKGNIATESREAILGGVTTVFDMPNTNPATVDAASLRQKYELAYSQDCRISFKPFIAASPGFMKKIADVNLRDIAGVKLFMGTTTGAMGAPDPKELAEVMAFCTHNNLTVVVHAEDNEIINSNAAYYTVLYGSPKDVPLEMHSRIRSREACLRASAAAVELAMRHGTRLHLAHISTADEVRELLSEGPVEGKQITAETTPLYLDPVLADATQRSWRHKVNPAIKTEVDAEEIRSALKRGAIDTIATDHAPHLAAEKQGGALTAASGAPSIRFALPVMLTYLPLQLIVNKMTAAPATIFGLGNYGTLNAGDPANIVIIKPEEYTITDSMVTAPCHWTPFHERKVMHRVTHVQHNGEQLL